MSSRDQTGPAVPPRASSPPKAAADAPEVVARVHEELSLVNVIAKQVGRELFGKVMFEDLVSFGREGLLGAARTFDPSLGVPFRRWANFRIRGAMLDGVRSMSMLPRSVYGKLRALDAGNHASEAAEEEGTAQRPASAVEADTRLSNFLAGIATAVAVGFLGMSESATGDAIDGTPPADEVLASRETVAAVRAAVASLPDPERHLIQRYYFDDVRLDHAAEEIGLSKSWGSRLHGRALESITRQLKKAHIQR